MLGTLRVTIVTEYKVDGIRDLEPISDCLETAKQELEFMNGRIVEYKEELIGEQNE